MCTRVERTHPRKHACTHVYARANPLSTHAVHIAYNTCARGLSNALTYARTVRTCQPTHQLMLYILPTTRARADPQTHSRTHARVHTCQPPQQLMVFPRTHTCAAQTLIDSNWLVTAAHCFCRCTGDYTIDIFGGGGVVCLCSLHTCRVICSHVQ